MKSPSPPRASTSTCKICDLYCGHFQLYKQPQDLPHHVNNFNAREWSFQDLELEQEKTIRD